MIEGRKPKDVTELKEDERYSAATWRILYTQGIPARTCGMAEQSAS